jgi:hypothetical protein
MENLKENKVAVAVNRGIERLEQSESFANDLEKPVQNYESDIALETSYQANNPELDALLVEETTTKAEEKAQETEQGQEQKAKAMIDSAQAAGIAVAGMNELVKGIGEATGRQIVFGNMFMQVVSCALAPVIQKYSRYIDVDPDGVDLDSWKPELYALGSLSLIGGSIGWQCRKPLEVDKGAENGDKC